MKHDSANKEEIGQTGEESTKTNNNIIQKNSPEGKRNTMQEEQGSTLKPKKTELSLPGYLENSPSPWAPKSSSVNRVYADQHQGLLP